MKKWVVRLLVGFFLFFVFVLLSFPWNRLAPRLAQLMSNFLTQEFRKPYTCDIKDLSTLWNLKISIVGLKCTDFSGAELIDFDKVEIRALPFTQSLYLQMDSGEINAYTNSAFGGAPSNLDLKIKDIQVSRVLPLVLSAANAFLFPTVTNLIVEGMISGSVQWPLKNMATSNGEIKIDLSRLNVPQQSYLELLGLPEISFKPTKIDLDLQKGVLNFKEAALSSDFLSGKLEGQWNMTENLSESNGDLLFKWKIQSSDAMRNSFVGQMLLNAPCPSPDALGFCTRRITRVADFQTLFKPSFR
ncbi:MAG: type II secretion system protein GspN [Bdellovibrionota bacterium]